MWGGRRPYRRAGLILVLLLGIGWWLPRAEGAVNIFSESRERAWGKEAHAEVLKTYTPYDNPALQRYVSQVGERIVRSSGRGSFRYQFLVLDDPSINAFALPGGYVYVMRGLLTELSNEAELAGVLAHEVGHAALHHAAKQYTRLLGYNFLTLGAAVAGSAAGGEGGKIAVAASSLFQQILLGYSREFELEADEFALFALHRAGYDPRAFIDFMRHLRLKNRLEGVAYHGFQSTHPSILERIVQAETLASILVSKGGRLERRSEEYLAHIDGLKYGQSRDRRYLKIYTVQAGETLQDIAQKTLGDRQKTWEIAFVNRLEEDTPLQEGEKLKVVLQKE
ncbi:MAG: LysM peptidoglycan-binding domain-containing protein [Nitrospinota bacterium]|nr:MAG: LysM peptidoglycan-binding domain-containing protein [Nitrospinota bacterium]